MKAELVKKTYRCPGRSMDIFQQVMRALNIIFKGMDKSRIFSPYSAVPLISQMLGLNTSLSGDGDSPYSITSYAFDLLPHRKLLDTLFNLPFEEKREFVDEVYDFIAPILLNQTECYIELLIRTKYFSKLKYLNSKERQRYKSDLLKKASLLEPFINRLLTRKGDFIHLAHYGYIDDLAREYDFLDSIPKEAQEDWYDNSFPVITELVIKKPSSGKSQLKKSICGWVIFVPNSTEQLLKSGKLRERKIIQAAQLGRRLGAKISGMGGLIASFAGGGYYLSKKIPSLGFTTGHAYTIANIMDILDKTVKRILLNRTKAVFAVVGAAGSIGSGTAKFLVQRGIKNIMLVDTTSFISHKKLFELKDLLIRLNPVSNISISSQISDIKKSDVVIIATNSPFSIIKTSDLRKGSVVIDDSFPKNVSSKTSDSRTDVIFLEGGAVQLPLDINVYIARNMPDLIDAPLTKLISCKESYSSFSETIILAFTKHRGNYGLGIADVKLAEDITKKARSVGIMSASLQWNGQGIDISRFERVKHILKSRKR